jgi:Xaa-Pro aminopeptidase
MLKTQASLSTLASAGSLPFDSGHLDRLMEDACTDVLLVTSKHNIQYLLGGYKFFFFDQFDAIGVKRYLPILLYPKGRPDQAVYIGNAMEDSEADNGRFWCPTVETKAWGTLDATALAIGHLRRLGLEQSKIGVEFSFFPADAMDALRAGLAAASVVDAHLPLERLRAVKTPDELKLIREASDRVVDAMRATYAACRPGMTKYELTARLRKEEVERGLNFEYCLITAGTGPNRAPSDQVIQAGDIISLDSGGRYCGYMGDMCRMGIVGAPDAELEELLGWVDRIQLAARIPLCAGMIGREVFAAVKDVMAASPHAAYTYFVAHGMGIISHEAPRLSDAGPVTYPAYDSELTLRAGMVLSIETTLIHPRRGFVKLEDTLAITETGWEAYGDAGRGWNTSSAQL